MRITDMSARILAVLVAGCAYPLTAQSTSGCRAGNAESARALRVLTNLVTTTDSAESAYRTSVGLQSTTSSSVSLATDKKTCQSGATAFNTIGETPGAVRQVFVYKVGTYFAVEDPGFGTEGEYRSLPTFDRRWAYQGTMLTF